MAGWQITVYLNPSGRTQWHYPRMPFLSDLLHCLLDTGLYFTLVCVVAEINVCHSPQLIFSVWVRHHGSGSQDWVCMHWGKGWKPSRTSSKAGVNDFSRLSISMAHPQESTSERTIISTWLKTTTKSFYVVIPLTIHSICHILLKRETDIKKNLKRKPHILINRQTDNISEVPSSQVSSLDGHFTFIYIIIVTVGWNKVECRI